MHIWALILTLNAGYGGYASSIATITGFPNEDACVTAGLQHVRSLTSSRSGSFLCVKVN